MISDDDRFVLMMVGFLSLGGAAGAAAVWWAATTKWMLAHSVLLPARRHPLVVLPGSAGAGIDLPRIAVSGSVLLTLIVFAIGGVLRRRRPADDLR